MQSRWSAPKNWSVLRRGTDAKHGFEASTRFASIVVLGTSSIMSTTDLLRRIGRPACTHNPPMQRTGRASRSFGLRSAFGARPAAERPSVMQQRSREKLPISYASPAHRAWSRLRHATARFSALVTTVGSAVGMWRIAHAIAPSLKDVPHLEWLVAAFVAVVVVVSISLGALVERVINRGNTAA